MVDNPADICVSRCDKGRFGSEGVIDAEEVAVHTGVAGDKSSLELTPLIVPLLMKYINPIPESGLYLD